MSAQPDERQTESASSSSASGSTAKVFLVDDHPAIRDALSLIISRNCADLTVCGETDSAPAALEQIGLCAPALAVIDITLKQGNGIELTEQIRKLYPHVRAVIYSMHDSALYAARARRAGAWGYVSKECGVAELIAVLRIVREGRRVFPETCCDDVRQNGHSRDGEGADAADLLSVREREVLQLLGEGFDMNTMADRMQLSVKTVETYRARLKKKLGITRRAELIRFAVERSLGRRAATDVATNGDPIT